jgi:drug/metabolite transporter (DMT)-like permease
MDFKHSKNLYNLNIRNIIVTAQGLVYTLSNFYLPLPIVSTINSTGPIFVFILDYYINGTTIVRSQVYGILIGMVGVIFTVNGGLILGLFD